MGPMIINYGWLETLILDVFSPIAEIQSRLVLIFSKNEIKRKEYQEQLDAVLRYKHERRIKKAEKIFKKASIQVGRLFDTDTQVNYNYEIRFL